MYLGQNDGPNLDLRKQLTVSDDTEHCCHGSCGEKDGAVFIWGNQIKEKTVKRTEVEIGKWKYGAWSCRCDLVAVICGKEM